MRRASTCGRAGRRGGEPLGRLGREEGPVRAAVLPEGLAERQRRGHLGPVADGVGVEPEHVLLPAVGAGGVEQAHPGAGRRRWVPGVADLGPGREAVGGRGGAGGGGQVGAEGAGGADHPGDRPLHQREAVGRVVEPAAGEQDLEDRPQVEAELDDLGGQLRRGRPAAGLRRSRSGAPAGRPGRRLASAAREVRMERSTCSPGHLAVHRRVDVGEGPVQEGDAAGGPASPGARWAGVVRREAPAEPLAGGEPASRRRRGRCRGWPPCGRGWSGSVTRSARSPPCSSSRRGPWRAR